MTGDEARMRRQRACVRAVLAFALAVSLAVNVLHAKDDLVSRLIFAWPPLALMLSVELISRVPADSRVTSWGRRAVTVILAGIAGWISYWHMAAVAKGHGERDYGSQYLWPLTVDGLAIVASLCLVEIGGRLTRLSEPVSPEPVSLSGEPEPEPVSLPGVRDPWTEPWVAAEPPVSLSPGGEPEPVGLTVELDPMSLVAEVDRICGEPEPVNLGDEPFQVRDWDARLDGPLAPADPWARSLPRSEPEPVSPEPEPVSLGGEPEPVSLGGEPEPWGLPGMLGSSNEKVLRAYRWEPRASNQRIADLTGLSLATVKRVKKALSDAGSLPGAEPVSLSGEPTPSKDVQGQEVDGGGHGD